jgi:hypothetical protein
LFATVAKNPEPHFGHCGVPRSLSPTHSLLPTGEALAQALASQKSPKLYRLCISYDRRASLHVDDEALVFEYVDILNFKSLGKSMLYSRPLPRYTFQDFFEIKKRIFYNACSTAKAYLGNGYLQYHLFWTWDKNHSWFKTILIILIIDHFNILLMVVTKLWVYLSWQIWNWKMNFLTIRLVWKKNLNDIVW